MQQCIELICTNDRGLRRDAENSVFFQPNLQMLFSLMKLRLEIRLLVIIAARVHPVTSRTRKLSSHTPMVLGGQPPGRVGHCQETFHLIYFSLHLVYASLQVLFKGQHSLRSRVGHCQETFHLNQQDRGNIRFARE